MVLPRNHAPVLLIVAMFAKDASALEWSTEQLQQQFGEVALRSVDQQFNQTKYYEADMGSELVKRLIAFKDLIDPALLPQIKLATIELEQQLSVMRTGDLKRPVNLDPGYLTEAKLVLATTKDRDHRLYLGHGIFGEVTLYYQQHRWQSSRWTYPDYQTAEVISFLRTCRNYLRRRYGMD